MKPLTLQGTPGRRRLFFFIPQMKVTDLAYICLGDWLSFENYIQLILSKVSLQLDCFCSLVMKR